ncbi:hypothetical protein [Thioalkalivibrio sp. HK1]|uniref:hypothetical protein n=1 Tax=Thioalkalivibrio sp. HK1 TaxID=1469245 RepID=UPI0004715D93|nr:hypothetical protein [Thioalkalivibrio sp. HK1]
MIDRLLRFLSPFFGDERRAKRLRRDAEEVIEIACTPARPERIRRIAERTAQALSLAHERGGTDPSRYGPIVEHFRTQHRQARQQRDDEGLTALTLVIIYLRAEMLEDTAAPARQCIDAFLSEHEQTKDD